ncbi:hypothetical protein OIE68_15465 [Nocardia vinacea]|uniref:hypothetical protein n=1 Tax=Nocardia vinacea TaxID=96468 RepID=UPI002E10B0EA|nr:hypothetical protein OIE68_15465 [Nocardia vinacea]
MPNPLPSNTDSAQQDEPGRCPICLHPGCTDCTSFTRFVEHFGDLTEPTGVWVVAGTSWGYEGPGYVIPYPNQFEALQAANETDYHRARFVPYGTDLNDVMNGRVNPATPQHEHAPSCPICQRAA